PWKLVKTSPEDARGVLTAALEAGRILTIYLKPILPQFAQKVETCLGLPPLEWKQIQDAMEPHTIKPFEHLVARLDTKAVDAMIEESKEAKGAPHGNAGLSPSNAGQTPEPPATPAEFEPLAPQIDINAFAAVDLRVGLVLAAEAIEKSDKLLKLQIDA